MRVKGLGDGTSPLGAYAIFIATLLLAIAAFFIGIQIKDAYSAETCLITREAYTQHSINAGHAKKGDMPDELVPGFMQAFNASPPTGGVFDAVTAFVWSAEATQPVTRLAFFYHDCLVDHYDIPNVMLMRLMQQGASGEEATE